MILTGFVYRAFSRRPIERVHVSLTALRCELPLLQAGQNIAVVSKRLGHASVSASDIYAHSLPGWHKQTTEAFAAGMQEG